jgi:hypothetical protein
MFFNEETFTTIFKLFINNLDTFTPKEYVSENLSDAVCAKKFLTIIEQV